MKLELASASNFLVHLLRLSRRQTGINESQLEKFRSALTDLLRRRYRDHWFPDKPFKGSGYRCIRINGKIDPVIGQAGESCGLAANLIHSAFPSELTMWIDPLEVSYRIGENGSICVLYEFREGAINEPWRPGMHNSSGGNESKKSVSNSNTPNKITVTSVDAKANAGEPCKESLRRMDYLLDPRNSMASMEHLAAYISSS